MTHRRTRTVAVRAGTLATALGLGLSVAVAGCSATTDAARETTWEATIGVITPMSGLDATLGKGVTHTVELAVNQANDAGTIPGWRLKVVAVDDEGDAATGAKAATKLADDPSVVAVVGSIYSGATSGSAPVFAKAGITQISPTATDSALTRGANFATKPARPYPTFFRVCPPDDFYAPALARTLAQKKLKRVALVDDGTDYGKGFNAAFAKEFTGSGGAVVAAGAVDPDTGDNAAAVKAVKAAKAQAVVFGGIDADAAPLTLALKAAGVRIPLAGGDGLYTPAYLPSSGIESAGDLSMLGGSPPESTDSGRAYLAAYRAQRFDAPVVPESPLTYDAARTVIAALAASLPQASDAKAARATTLAAMKTVRAQGLDGPISFDPYGEVTRKTATVYRVSGGDWVVDTTLGSS